MCLAALAVMAVATFAIAAPLSAGIAADRRIDSRVQSGQLSNDLRVSVTGLIQILDQFAASTTPADATAIATAATKVNAEVALARHTAAVLTAGGFGSAARRITSAQLAFEKTFGSAASLTTGVHGPDTAALVESLGSSQTQVASAGAAAATEVAAARDRDARSASASFGQARSNLLVMGAIVVIGIVAKLMTVFAKRLRRREHHERSRSLHHE